MKIQQRLIEHSVTFEEENITNGELDRAAAQIKTEFEAMI